MKVKTVAVLSSFNAILKMQLVRYLYADLINSCGTCSLLLLFATTGFVVKSVKVSIVEVAKRTN